MEDYYDILGLGKGASEEDVKKAYRRLARKHHPDVSKEADAEETFKKINEAYQVLSDPQKKQAYDQFGHAAYSQGQSGGFPGGGQGPFTYSYSGQGVDFEDLFGGASTIFDTFFGGGFRRRGQDVRYQITIEFIDTVRGLEKEIEVGGKTLTIKIPAGVRTGSEIRFAGKGEEGPRGPQGEQFPPGDLYLHVHVSEQTLPDFEIHGADILIRHTITFPQAALGDTVRVPVVDPTTDTGVRSVKLKIPAGTQSGKQLRIRGKGMPRVRGRGRGDAYVKVLVDTPRN